MKLRRKIYLPTCLSVLLLVFSCFSEGLIAQETEAEGTDAVGWILKLDDVDPKVREQAEAAILKLGDRAIPAIKKGIQHSSLEVSRRCIILFEKIELQKQRRIAEIFLAEDFDEKELARFEAWNSFSKFAQSTDVATRKMFLDMCNQIPLAFEDFEIKGERTAASLKQLARLILIPNKHPKARSESIVVAYLFLAEQAQMLHTDSNNRLFSEVEVLEAVSFFSTNQHAMVGKNSKNRKVVDRVVAHWLNARKPFDKYDDPSRLRLIFHTSNLELIADLAREYESMTVETKLKYLDIVSRAFSNKDQSALKRSLELLEKPLADGSVVASSRFRRRPAEKIDVSLRLLAEAILAGLLKISGENALQIELEPVFGAYPMSFAQFSIIKKEKDRQALTHRVQARIGKSDGVK